MATRGLKLKMALIQQGDAMVPRGEMAVLEAGSNSEQEFLSLLTRGIRFLRSGCSGVQVLITTSEFNAGVDGYRKQQRQEMLNTINEALGNLRDNGREIFEISSPKVWEQGTVITITRRIADKTEYMTFGEVPERRHFLVALNDDAGANPKEVECVKVAGNGATGQYHYGIRLDQDGSDASVYLGVSYPVNLIV